MEYNLELEKAITQIKKEKAKLVMIQLPDGLKPKAGWVTQKAIITMLEFIGFGRPEFVKAKIEKNGHHHIIFHVKDNPVIEHAKRMFGSKSLICNWFMGIYAAHGEMELGLKHAKVKENKCVCKGALYCEWESKW